MKKSLLSLSVVLSIAACGGSKQKASPATPSPEPGQQVTVICDRGLNCVSDVQNVIVCIAKDDWSDVDGCTRAQYVAPGAAYDAWAKKTGFKQAAQDRSDLDGRLIPGHPNR